MSTDLCQLPVVSFIWATCCLKEQNNKTKQWNHLFLMLAIVSLGSCSAHRVKGQDDHRWQLLFNRADHVEPTSREIHSVNGPCNAYQFNFPLRERRLKNLKTKFNFLEILLTFGVIFLFSQVPKVIEIEISPTNHSPQHWWRVWWHFIVHTTVLESHRGKELLSVEFYCGQGLKH